MKALKRADKGAQVKLLQRAVNRIMVDFKMPWRKITVDGRLGPHSLKAVGFASWLIGLERRFTRQAQKGHVSVETQRVLRRLRKRGVRDRVRKLRRAGQRRKLRRLHNRRPKNGVGVFDGKQVANWIVPWLEKSRKAGWKGTVTSGYRDPAYSQQLCYAMCGAPSCPGRCAGTSSNHVGSKDGEGAVDVTDYTRFARIQKQIGSPLKNALGPADPVHFSRSGH